MREIKFRGQHIDTKEWVYGDLVQVINHPTGLKAYIAADGDTKLFYPGCRFCEINPETIGQFTGLHDKNGKEIYDGDIFITSTGVTAVVEWEKEGRFLGFTVDSEKKIVYISREPAVEIIGNIHDNKEAQ